jgi:hypothetical protein
MSFLFSTFAFSFNVRRYNKARAEGAWCGDFDEEAAWGEGAETVAAGEYPEGMDSWIVLATSSNAF